MFNSKWISLKIRFLLNAFLFKWYHNMFPQSFWLHKNIFHLKKKKKKYCRFPATKVSLRHIYSGLLHLWIHIHHSVHTWSKRILALKENNTGSVFLCFGIHLKPADWNPAHVTRHTPQWQMNTVKGIIHSEKEALVVMVVGQKWQIWWWWIWWDMVVAVVEINTQYERDLNPSPWYSYSLPKLWKAAGMLHMMCFRQ